MYLFFQAIVIVAVILFFKLNQDIKTASVEAGLLFVLMPAVLLGRELFKYGFSRKIWFAAVLQFWLLFALPIFALRLFNWDAQFEALSLFGIPGTQLHFWSNKSYILMMAVTAWESWKNYSVSSE